MENYFREQPSGRNLLHVHASQALTAHEAAAAAAAEAAAQVLPPRIGEYVEAPSGRSIMHANQQGDGTTSSTHRVQHSGGVDFATGMSEGVNSSRWNDSDAASRPYEAGLFRSASAMHAPMAMGAVSVPPDEAAGGSYTGPPRDRRANYIAPSPGSEAASRPRDSFRTIDSRNYAGNVAPGHSSAAAAALQFAAASSTLSGTSSSEGPRGQLIMQTSSSSSSMSRVRGPQSDVGSESPGLIGQASFRPSPGHGPEMKRGYSVDTISSGRSPRRTGEGPPQRGDSMDDGDYGTVWLASRQHARHLEAPERR